MNPAQRLGTALARGLVVAPGAFDCLTARLVERAGFEAVYMTGFGATAARVGTPDLGVLGLSEMAEHARSMVRSVSIPVIADADTGYGGPSNIHRTVREYIQAGVAALHLEDQQAPKRCGQMAGIRLDDADVALRRLECAVAARGDDPLLLIARTDGLAVSIEEALARAHRYREAGVDLLFVDGVKSVEQVHAIAAGLPGPKVISLVDGTPASALTHRELAELGYSLALHAVSALFAATHAVAAVLDALRERGSSASMSDSMIDYEQFCDIVDLPFHASLDDRYG